MDRRHVLDEINHARWNNDANQIIFILQSSNIHVLTKDDIHDLYVNILCRTANDKFSNDLFALKAIDIFHQIFPTYSK